MNQNLHHFNIVEGDHDFALEQVFKICQDILKFNPTANRNFNIYRKDNLLVDDAKEFSSQQNRKIAADEIAVSVISAGSINISAQNSLLKVLEEPTKNHFYFLIVPQKNILLPTILSRAMLLEIGDTKPTDESDILNEIKKMPYKDRLKKVEKIVADIKKEKIDKSEARKMVQQIIAGLNEEFLANTNRNKNLGQNLKSIQSSAKYLDNQGASLKSILEHIMLSVPKI